MTMRARSDGVVVRDLRKVYFPSARWMRLLVRSPIRQPVEALKGIDFEVGPGEMCAVVGPNGAGKTTTFRILVGLTTPSSGEARVNGLDAHHDSLDVRRQIGWMPTEDRSLLMRLTCAENLHFHGKLHGLFGRDLTRKIDEALTMVGLREAASSSVFALSAGMRARLQLARAVIHDPRVLILDEPTASVDPVASYELINVIMATVAERRLTALISSHRLDEIEALRSNVVLLDRGMIRFNGDLDVLRDKMDRLEIEIEFQSEADAAAGLAHLEGCEQVDKLTVDRRVIRARLLAKGTTGAVLARLQPVADRIGHVREHRLPLRELLAEMYLGHGPEEME